MDKKDEACALHGCHCELPMVPERPLDEVFDPNRAALIRYNEKKWLNGTVLHYYFFEAPAAWKGSAAQKQAVREAFQHWKDLGLGLEFVEADRPENAEVRIAFQPGGSWSYIGRDILTVRDPLDRTTNFGWDLTTPYGRDTALHEIGHVLGFPHEHQNPQAGIVWNEPAVLQYFKGSPNFWGEEKIRWNILRKIPAQEVGGSDWDRHSIMHYRFEAGLINSPAQYKTQPLIPGGGLSETDIAEARGFYPPMQPEGSFGTLAPFVSQQIAIAAGQQLNFIVTTPYDRQYTIQTFGPIDTVMVLFEEIEGVPRLLAGDDNSGVDFNASLNVRLFRGRKYILRVRLFYAERAGNGAIMMW